MKTLLLLLLASPVWAYVSPWDDCARWNEDVASRVEEEDVAGRA